MPRVRGSQSRVLSHTPTFLLYPNFSASLRYAPTGDTCVGVSRGVTRRALSSWFLYFLIVGARVRIRKNLINLLDARYWRVCVNA